MWFGSSKSHDCSVFAVFVAVLICLVPVAGPDRPMLVKIDHLHKFKCIEESFQQLPHFKVNDILPGQNNRLSLIIILFQILR